MKRFYQTVTIVDAGVEAGINAGVEAGDSFGIMLDGRPVRTPERRPFAVPTRALAQEIRAEWQAQSGQIDPATMPLTQFTNVVIDRIAVTPDPVQAELVAYGGSDLLCYRAEAPDTLVRREAQAWDPLLGWAADTVGARLTVTSGIMHSHQPASALQAFKTYVARLSAFELTGVRAAAGHLGSLVLALALHAGRLDAVSAHAAATIDEAYQIERWGADSEAATRQAAILAELEQIERFLRALRPSTPPLAG